MRTDQEEPGYGRYQDKDKAPGDFWLHDVRGWTFCHQGVIDDEREPWSHARNWAPMTKIEEPAGEELRRVALECASHAAAGEPVSWEEIIRGARLFEAYLKGGE